jgi:enoyl-CoA hydratase/carnithine racemase
VLGADLIIAAENTPFADTHAKWGLYAGWGMSARLPRRVGVPSAKRMSYSAKEVLAGEVLRIGLADMVVPNEKLYEEGAVAGDLDRGQFDGGVGLRWLKKTMAENVTTDALADALALERATNPGFSPDAAARVAVENRDAAFLEGEGGGEQSEPGGGGRAHPTSTSPLT